MKQSNIEKIGIGCLMVMSVFFMLVGMVTTLDWLWNNVTITVNWGNI